MRTLGLQLALSGLIFIAVQFGRQSPLTLPSLYGQPFTFDRCGTALCFKGIIPEVTTFTEAMSLLREYTSRLPADIPVGEDITARVSFSSSDLTNLTISQITVTRKGMKPLFPVGWAISTYGIPCQIELDSPSRIILSYPFVSVRVRRNNAIHPHLTVHDHVTELVLHGNMRVNRCKVNRIVSRSWSGFASLHLYSTHFK